MILDMQSLFSDNQAITATAVSTNVVDLGATEAPVNRAAPTNPALIKDLGKGEPVPLLIQVTEDFDALTSLNISIEIDTVEAFSSATEVIEVEVVLADLVAGYQTPIIWVPTKVNERFMRLNYTVTGSNPTVGTITAGLCMGVQTNVTG